MRKIINWFRSLLKKEPNKVPRSDLVLLMKDESTKTTHHDKNYSNMDAETVRLSPEFEFIGRLINYRMMQFLSNEENHEPAFPEYKNWYLPMAEFIRLNKLAEEDAILLLTGIIPHVQPGLFDYFIDQTLNSFPEYKGDFPRLGGVRGKNSRFFLPTGETALFLIAGDDLNKRLQVQQLFGAEHIFWEKKILWLEDMQNGEPSMHGRLIISPDYVDLLTYGIHKSPQFSISFPAKKIAPSKKETAPSFEQLVIPAELGDQIQELKNWLQFNEQLMNEFGMRDKVRKGYRTLFYGPPGTGKTFTAQILGNDLKKEVYKIDLSMVVSKYIGETEKNLELLFARAEDKGWILFFDEADALFGKRTNVRDAHDKYANQEVSYLLQRIEDYNGLVILATNMKNNIDDAFIRRFNSILKFPFPDAGQRARIFKKSFPEKTLFREKQGSEKDIDIPDAVKKYELSGGSIMNVVHYAGIKAVEHYNNEKQRTQIALDLAAASVPMFTIYLTDVLEGIKRELIKEGKPFAI